MPAEDRGTKDEGQGAPVRSIYGIDASRLPDDEEEARADQSSLPAPPDTTNPALDPQMLVVEARRSRVRSFREWWHEESLARAAEKRARATAEAILRAQAIQAASAPANRAPSEADRAQSVQSVLALTDERFQALGVRSDRVQDELAGISNVLGELRSLVIESGSEPVAQPATEIIGDLEDRLDGLREAIAEQLRRHGDEMEARISALMRLQTAELATLLGDAVIRLRAAIPEELEQTRISFATELEQVGLTLASELEPVRSLADEVGRAGASSAEALAELAQKIPEGFDRLLSIVPEELEKLRAEHADEMRQRSDADRGLVDGLAEKTDSALERVRSTFVEEIEALRSLNREEAKRLRAANGEEMVRLRVANAGELERMHQADEEAYRSLRDLMAEAAERLRNTSSEELARLRVAIPEGVERLRSFNEEELERIWARGDEEIARIRTAGRDRLVEVHDVLAFGLEHLRAAIPEPMPARVGDSEPPEEPSELRVQIPEAEEPEGPGPSLDVEEVRSDTASVLERLRAENEAALAHLRAALAQ